MKIKGKENRLRSGERNIRTTAKRAGKEEVVPALPDAGLFLHVRLSHALKSASDGPSWYQNIRVDSYYNVPFSHLLVPQDKQTAWVKECIPPHKCQKISGSLCLLSSPDPINYTSCVHLGFTWPYFPTYCMAWQWQKRHFSSPSFFLSFC